MKKTPILFAYLFLFFTLFMERPIYAQLPTNVLVGYHENWGSLKLTQAHPNYNVICLAFALPVNYPSVGYDLRYALPPAYSTVAQMMADIDILHSQGKVVLLSIGGATGPIMLNSAAEQTTFENSITNIFTTYGNKIDGLDMDLETSSMAFGSTWTMTSPAAGQTRMVNAIQNVMATYLATNGKKMLLTMAPETIYLMGGLSTYQVANTNGGAFLPILDGLRNDFDLLHMQLYNAGGASGGVIAWNGTIYYDTGNIDFALSMNESVIKGFTCVSGKGTFAGIPSTKVAFGLPATSAASTAGTGYVTPAKICLAVQYFKGTITKAAAGATYTMTAAYPGMKGLMTWSIDEDYTSVNGQWNFANGYTCAFPLPVEFTSFNIVQETQGIQLTWQTASEQNADHFSVQRSTDGTEFIDITNVPAYGNSNSLRTYNYVDPISSSGTLYYRIKETDIDGKTTFTSIKAVHLKSLNVDIYPNPSNGSFTLRTDQTVSVTLQNMEGITVSSFNFNPEEYSKTFGSALTAGIYILSVQAEGKIDRIRLVKE
ncbi:MAG TPA: glycosyl hydrolase family 18 protein [Cytophagaceae bacterium]|jgi:chitinase|nr:glycosyl hydrolase family 18 protein [Cytophagaceae bacterium]